MFFLLCLTAVLAFGMRRQMPDDAYIYLRISQNIVGLHQWAFNPGVPVNAATSPLYAVLLSLIVLLHLPGLTTALIVAAAIGLFALAWAIFAGTRFMGLPAALLMAMVGSTFPTLLRAEGLETPVYLALIALTALAVEGGNEWLIGLAAGFTILGRPEGVAMAGLAVGTQWIRSGRLPWRGACLAVLPLGIWLAYCRYAFGTIVPHTMKIKALQSGVKFWSGSWFAEFLTQLPGHKVLFVLALVGLVMAVRQFRHHPFLLLILLFGIVQTVGYTVLKAPPGYFWYDAPGVLAYYLSTLLGLLAAVRFLLGQVGQASPGKLAGATGVLIAGYLALAFVWERGHSTPYRASPEYIAAATWVRDHSNPQDWVAADEIGYIGVYSRRPVRDMLGLADPGSVFPLTQHRWDFWLTAGPEPRFIVVHTPRWPGEPGFTDTPFSDRGLRVVADQYHPVFRDGVIEVMQHD